MFLILVMVDPSSYFLNLGYFCSTSSIYSDISKESHYYHFEVCCHSLNLKEVRTKFGLPFSALPLFFLEGRY
jgi:hypothetical protein